uniref:Reverse transcriptase domain-containing protein n=1 Tax=Tanacetum cinerariifolium TaxID=118510 RepID=A0A699HN41_TANCI|nr:reverse transcriptase domain-containing protein [Tanacetum cinerariifolium]
MESQDEHEDDHGGGNENGNGDGGENGNGNRICSGIGNGNPNVNVRGVVPVVHECTYQDFVKCQPLNFKGTKGVEKFLGGLPDNIQRNVINADLRDSRMLFNRLGNKSNEARGRAYGLGGGGAYPDSNIVIVIICGEKVIRIPYRNEIIEIEGHGFIGKNKLRLSIISCTMTQNYIQKGCQVFLAQFIEKEAKDKLEEKRLEDVPIVRDFLKVFP